jgi:serine phosphatase RsbU (regulator of sigma subunit)
MVPLTEAEQTIALLRAQYTQQLPQRALEVEDAWRRAQCEGAPGLVDLRMLAHRLAGSGASYGFPEVSTSARVLESAVIGTVGRVNTQTVADLAPLAPFVESLVLRLRAPDAPVDTELITYDDLPGGDRNGRAMRVLVVDDDYDIVAILTISLIQAGYKVASVSSGEAAIEYLLETPTDLVILDVLMPGMSGLQVLEYLRDLVPNMAVIVTTAHGSEEVAIGALRRGADDYLRKPFDVRDLRVTLGRTVEMVELRRQNAELQQQLEEKHQRLEKELARAARVQADLLPSIFPSLPGYDMAARCVPARNVGGDFYDWQIVAPGLLNLTFGDVMGKGMPAALLMTAIRAVMRSTARAVSPAINMRYASGVLEPDLEGAGSFVTMFHAQLEVQTGRVGYIDAGHGCAFVYRADGTIDPDLEPRGVPVGVPRVDPFIEGVVVLNPGDALVIFSDGLLDARPDLLAAGNRAFEPVVAGAPDARELLDRLFALVDIESPLPDDLTAVVLMRH